MGPPGDEVESLVNPKIYRTASVGKIELIGVRCKSKYQETFCVLEPLMKIEF